MFNNFKIKISLWYAMLFTIIIASTLFASYKIIGYQLKNEIINNLKNKTDLISSSLNEKKYGEHKERESHEHHRENNRKEDATPFSSDINEIKNYTELTDNNYILFIYKENKLIYISAKHQNFVKSISKYNIPNKNIRDIQINNLSFSLSTIHTSGYSIYVGYELSTLKNLQNKLINIFLIVFPISLLLSILCGYIVTQSSMNIVNRISKTAKKITSNNLSKRIELPKGKDEITRLIETLNSMIDRLEKSFNQAKQFSQDAAHEIRTPLTIIRGEIEELIINENNSRNTTHTLENILEEVQYLSSISERLLMIHNMDTNNIKYHFEDINLSKLLDEIYQDILILSMEKNIKVTLESSEDIIIKGNKELLSRLLWNLADNAIKYNTPNGSVNIKLFNSNTSTIIKIKDSGIGIPEKDISKIFERFYRVDKSRARQLGGSGLGLSICKWIAKLHNGNITAESKEQSGSTFTITLT